jgi:hypothetical protein
MEDADMANLDETMSPPGGAIAAAGGFLSARSAVAARPTRLLTFGRVLVCSALAVAALGGYESLTEKYYPRHSILALAHSYGYLKAYQIVYEPGKGIWRVLGWTGSAMMLVMMLYSVRKRVAAFGSLGSMRRWLSAHIFLGVMGPLLVTLHTTFKFHGIIATSFWCMIVTMVFGILGRYIYVQIPRGISGVELGVKEIEQAAADLDRELGRYLSGDAIARILDGIASARTGKEPHPLLAFFLIVRADMESRLRVRRLSASLKDLYPLPIKTRQEVLRLLRKKAVLVRRRNLLSASHRLLHYWHVFHVPLAAVMFLIMFVHIAVYYVFRPWS